MRRGKIGVRFEGRLAVITLRGDIDLAIDPELNRLVDQVTARVSTVVFDLSEAEFVGLTAVRAFLQAYNLLGRRTACVRIRASTRATDRMLDATRLRHLFVFEQGRNTVPTGRLCRIRRTDNATTEL